MSESEETEHKSQFSGSTADLLQIVKTLLSFANSRGGKIIIDKVIDGRDRLDSARLDDLINKYVAPRVGGIISEETESGAWTIIVPQSAQRPHIIKTEASFQDEKGKTKSAFYQGQIYVRHSSKAEPAAADDITRIINDRLSALLSSIGNAFKEISIEISKNQGMPVRLDVGAGVSINVGDINKLYPYTAKTLATAIKKDQNWVAYAAKKLCMKSDRNYCYEIYGNGKSPAMVRYNEAARKKLEDLCNDKNFNPYK
jgi:hypothetical protein